MARKMCRHCRRKIVSRSRGLCYACYYDRDVLELYQPATRRGLGIYNHPSQPPRQATTALPGTAEKLRVMSERAARGEALHHAEDGLCAEETVRSDLQPKQSCAG